MVQPTVQNDVFPEKRETDIKQCVWTKLKETVICCSAFLSSKSDHADTPANIPVSCNIASLPPSSTMQTRTTAMNDSQRTTLNSKGTSEESKRRRESSKVLPQNKGFVSYRDIIAEYKLSKRPIGSGTFAVVYKGVSTKDGKDYALKFIDKKVLDSKYFNIDLLVIITGLINLHIAPFKVNSHL
ncbi:hypothetical protein DSO57_1028231 [Entomophthora muscae]|uniref:Uncharacterized protein n=1 Tax=Entomophthora muscae TaxID=34485 RepID=A0ACC2TCW6_9FUNG|nr:hypothetical protein DSO57_1028231 [Entomophthora muscae]